MPAGGNVCIEIDNLENFDIARIEVASADGEAVSVIRAAKEVALPEEFALHQNYPNPFNPQTTISFDLAAAARAEMAVYNVLGQEVRLLIDGYLPAGKHSVVWDGRDDNNQQVSSGVYFYRLVSQGNALTRKMIMLK
jgi:flagellar hook assembly protein FlgD